jgi:site-specific DNA recombinase
MSELATGLVGSGSEQESDLIKAVIYTRVSTAGQVEDGVSLDLQRERLTAYAASQGWTVTACYEDAGFSGSNMNRPALTKMFDDARAHVYDRILIYKIDRLSRSVSNFYAMYAELDKLGIGLVSSTQSFDTTTATGKLLLSILVGFAGFERDMIVERTRDAEARLKEQGKLVCGVAPYGFKHLGKGLCYDMEVLPIAQQIIRRICAGETERELARSLGLTRDRIRSVLHNPLYAGRISYGKRGKNGSRIGYQKWQYVPFDGIDPIMEFDDWLAMQQQLTERTDRPEGETLPLFGRLIWCDTCHHLLSAHGSNRRNRTKYACQKASLGQAACGTQVWEHYLLPVVLAKLSEELRRYVPRFDGSTRLAALDARATKIDRQICQLEERMAMPDVPVDRIRTNVAALREERHQLLQDRAAIDEESLRLSDVQTILSDFAPFFAQLDRRSQLQAMQRFIRRIDLGVTNIVIHWQFSETDCIVGRSEVSPEARKKGVGGRVVEIGGLEPPTSCMPCRRSPS